MLKSCLTCAPVLAFPDFTVDTQLETDTSGVGLEIVLSQVQTDGNMCRITFAIRTLQTHECNYGIMELEALAVVYEVKHFRQYLYDHKCSVITDHEALKSLLSTPLPSGKLARLILQELDLDITYHPGNKNPRQMPYPAIQSIRTHQMNLASELLWLSGSTSR